MTTLSLYYCCEFGVFHLISITRIFGPRIIACDSLDGSETSVAW